MYNYASIDYIMDFEQEHEDSGLITPMHTLFIPLKQVEK